MDVSDWKVLIDCGSFSITKDALFFSNVIITFCQCYSRVQMSFLFSPYGMCLQLFLTCSALLVKHITEEVKTAMVDT